MKVASEQDDGDADDDEGAKNGAEPHDLDEEEDNKKTYNGVHGRDIAIQLT